MTTHRLVALGIGQCVNWGVLYYAFAVLVVPLERELGVQTWVVTGAFSLALLMSATLAPAVGRWCDRGHGPALMHAGNLTAAVLLATWTFMDGVVPLYFVWAGMGFCMAATLYEPAFMIVGRSVDDPARRLRALATVTLFGGLASTVFLPTTAALVSAIDWRGAVRVLAVTLVCAAGAMHTLVFRHIQASRVDSPGATPPEAASVSEPGSGRFLFVVASFALASLASAGFAANLVPALGERGVPPDSAALLGGLIGVMQLPGRALLMRGTLAASPARLITGSFLLHAVGLAAVALAPSMLVVAVGTMIFALGAGLTTLTRPHVIQAMFVGGGGRLNGRVARHQQLARAAGPLAVAWLGNIVGYSVVFIVIGALFTALALASQSHLEGGRDIAITEDTR